MVGDNISDITDDTNIVYSGTSRIDFKCECGKEIIARAGCTTVCDCKNRYGIGVRLYRNVVK